jgi:hypothetical protein
MSTTFAPTALPQVAPSDPTKHVNYSLGMVLGVDDFNQEFTYLSGHDDRIVRDLIGYGVVYGLRVSVDADAERGPVVHVAPGEAVTPSGRLVCVSPAQCAYLNDWLAANRATLGSPPSDLQLSVVACYRECPTDDVPIPGEPCRSDDELMAPSRLQEGFTLDLRLAPTAQTEEDSVRDFVRFARAIPLVAGPGPGVDAFLESLRSAAGLELSPPSSPPGLVGFLLGSPPAGVEIPRDDAAEYVAALFRFWAEELRPALRSTTPGAECGCGGTMGELDADADCITLATLDVPLAIDELTGTLLVADTPAVGVDDTTRPTLLHLRLLQEWLLGGGGSGASLAAHVDADGTATGSSLDATVLEPTVFALSFPEFDPSRQYVVTGAPVAAYADVAPSTFEVIPAGDADLHTAHGAQNGIVVRVKRSDGTAVPGGFAVRIDEIGATT